MTTFLTQHPSPNTNSTNKVCTNFAKQTQNTEIGNSSFCSSTYLCFLFQIPRKGENDPDIANDATLTKLDIGRKQAVLLKAKDNVKIVSYTHEDKKVPLNFVKLNRLMRKNLGLSIGDDEVTMEKCDLKIASKVTLALAANEDSVRGWIGNFEDVFIKPHLDKKPITVGETLIVRKCFRDFTFKVNLLNS